jgi:hypothetical protein
MDYQETRGKKTHYSRNEIYEKNCTLLRIGPLEKRTHLT